MTEPDSPQPNSSAGRILSVPALAAALRQPDTLASSAMHSFRARTLVPMYQINDRFVDRKVSDEAAAVATVVSDISERLRRMGTAYGEWETFDGPAYFDLLAEQHEWLVKMIERVSTVNVTFYVDLLIPSFRHATSYLNADFYPAYLAAHKSTADYDATDGADAFAAFFETAQPEMVARWERLLAVVHNARELLADDIGWMATNGGQAERFLHHAAWQQSPDENLDAALAPPLPSIPTLIRSFEFTLPAHRQSDRVPRLRRNRERARRDEQRTL